VAKVATRAAVAAVAAATAAATAEQSNQPDCYQQTRVASPVLLS